MGVRGREVSCSENEMDLTVNGPKARRRGHVYKQASMLPMRPSSGSLD